tara:strand:+ start:2784 stop:3335 length:552 start_codon:yes stop_codon:yes gene_type:complete
MAHTLHAYFSDATIQFIPCAIPVHKETDTLVEHRLAMLKLAIEPYPYCKINTIEIETGKPCYTLETVKKLRQQYPNTPIAWIIGSDQDLTTWYNWESLFDYVHIISIQRTPKNPELSPLLKPFHTRNQAHLKTQTSGLFWQSENTPHPISSTEIRHDIEKYRHEIPDEVADYIKQYSLFCNKD